MNSEMPKIKRWETIRQGGMGKFILLWGVLFFGMIQFIVAVSTYVSVRNVFALLAVAAVCGFGGAFFGWSMWSAMERSTRSTWHLGNVRNSVRRASANLFAPPNDPRLKDRTLKFVLPKAFAC
jgi:hypothetical protein